MLQSLEQELAPANLRSALSFASQVWLGSRQGADEVPFVVNRTKLLIILLERPELFFGLLQPSSAFFAISGSDWS